MSRTETKRFNFCVPIDDEAICSFFAAQHNQTATFKQIVREAIQRYGVRDVFSTSALIGKPQGASQPAKRIDKPKPKAETKPKPKASEGMSKAGVSLSFDAIADTVDGSSGEHIASDEQEVVVPGGSIDDAALSDLSAMMAD